MGHAQSINTPSSRSVSVASSDGGAGRQKHHKEHKRHGVVTMKMTLHNPTRRNSEQHITQTITPKGCILYGSLAFDPAVVQHAIATSGFPVVPPSSFQLGDNRAHKVLVSYCKGWHIVPFPEIFSRHSGTCLILGDRTITSPPFQVKVGDCFRLGSVGLVVSEMRADGEIEQRIDAKTLEFLKDEALAFDTNGDLATLAADEERLGHDGLDTSCDPEGDDTFDNNNNLNATFNSTFRNNLDPDDNRTYTNHEEQTCHTPERGGSIDSTGNTPIHFESALGHSPERAPKCANKTHNHDKYIGVGGISPGERFVCYMCYETHDTEDDALVAPCDCRGDTRYLHVQCLQKWYQASITGVQTQVIRTTGNGAPACKICGSAYKTAFRKADGRKASLLETESTGPYLSLVVVTKHDTNPGLFNTKFRLNFHSRQEAAQNVFADAQEENVITIGRSSSCNMILDYRTVSTIHARISYEADGKFYLTDRNSSNGTMVYLQDPFPLPYNQTLKLRMGRTTLALQAKRNWTSSLRTMLGTSLPASEAQSPTPEDLQDILAHCAGIEEEHEHNTVKEDALTLDGGSLHHQRSQHDNNNIGEQAEHDGQVHFHEIDGLPTSANTHTQGSMLRHPPIDVDSHFDPPAEGSHRTNNNTHFHSLNSSMTGVTNGSLPASHPFSSLPYGSSQFTSGSHRSNPPSSSSIMPNLSNRNRVIPLRAGNSLSEYPGYEEGLDSGMTEEERQLQEDINRAIELSLIEQQLLEHHNESLKAAGNASMPSEATDHTELANAKDEPSFVENDHSAHSPRAFSPSAKSPRPHAGLNRTYTEFSEGEIGVAANSSHLDIINSIPSNFDDNRKMSAGLSTPPRSRQASQGVLPGLQFALVLDNTKPAMAKSPSKAMMDFSQPRVVAEDEDNTERPSPRVHLSGASSPTPQHYNNVSVLGSGRLVVHDAAHNEVLGNHSATLDEGVRSSTPGKPSSGSDAMTQEELSMSLPTAGAFTTFGQMSHRKNQPSHPAESSATLPSSSAHTGDGATVSPRGLEPMKENCSALLYKQASFNKGTLSKEHSFKKNTSSFGNVSVHSSSNNIAAMPQLEKQRSGRGDASNNQCSADYAQHHSSPSMQRNATTLDLETSPDHEDGTN